MKKLFTIAALTLATTAAMAGSLTGKVQYDYGKATGTGAWGSDHSVTYSLKQGFDRAGSVEAGLITAKHYYGPSIATGNGFKLGYSNSVNVGPVNLLGKVEFGRVDGLVQTGTRGTIERTSYGVEGSMPVVAGVRGVVEYGLGRSKTEVDGGFSNRNRSHLFGVAVDFDVTKNISTRVGVSRTMVESSSENRNGMNVALNYKF